MAVESQVLLMKHIIFWDNEYPYFLEPESAASQKATWTVYEELAERLPFQNFEPSSYSSTSPTFTLCPIERCLLVACSLRLWKLALVNELLPGEDGQIRAAVIWVGNERGPARLLKRSVRHLILIEASTDDESSQPVQNLKFLMNKLLSHSLPRICHNEPEAKLLLMVKCYEEAGLRVMFD